MSSFKRSFDWEICSWLLQISGFVIWKTSFCKLAVGWSFGTSFCFHDWGTPADLSVSVTSGACDSSMSSWLGVSTEANGLYIDLNLEHFWWYFVNLISIEKDLVIFNMTTMKKDFTIFSAEHFSWLQSSFHLSLLSLFVFGGAKHCQWLSRPTGWILFLSWVFQLNQQFIV